MLTNNSHTGLQTVKLSNNRTQHHRRHIGVMDRQHEQDAKSFLDKSWRKIEWDKPQILLNHVEMVKETML